MRAGCALLVFLLACGGSYGGRPPAKPKPPGGDISGGIEKAGLPYSILDARTGHQIDTEAFWQKLGTSQVVCVGEDHKNPHHHWVQLEVMNTLATRLKGRRLALGMEMFQRPFQGVLDDYAANRIDEAALLSRTDWENRWGFDYGFYRPTIRRAVTAGAALVALNAARELVQQVARKGLGGLSAEDKAKLPEMVLDDKKHRAWFDATMESMGDSHMHQHAQPKDGDDKDAKDGKGDADAANEMPSEDNIYAAQVLWDETMADTAASWTKATANGVMVVLAGNGHCHDSAVVGRIKRRGIENVVSVRPVLDTEGNVAEALANPMNDFLVVLQLPH